MKREDRKIEVKADGGNGTNWCTSSREYWLYWFYVDSVNIFYFSLFVIIEIQELGKRFVQKTSNNPVVFQRSPWLVAFFIDYGVSFCQSYINDDSLQPIGFNSWDIRAFSQNAVHWEL